jgi:hypothetical protein
MVNKRDNWKAGIRDNLWMLVAILCTIFWGSAAPTIKLGYIYFNLEPTDVYSILVFAGLRFLAAAG